MRKRRWRGCSESTLNIIGNGNQWLLYITGNPSVSFAEGSGMGWATVSADWTEVGDPNDRHDMYEAGMIPEED